MKIRRAGKFAIAVAFATSTVITLAPGVAHAAGTLSVSPDTGLTDGQTITATVSGETDTPLAQIQLAECGNAFANGTPLTAIDPTTDCTVGGWINAANGSVSFPALQTGLGTGNRSCIDFPPAHWPCYVYAAQSINIPDRASLNTPIYFGSSPEGGAPMATTTSVVAVGSPVAIGKTPHAFVTVSTGNPVFKPDGSVTVTEGDTVVGTGTVQGGTADVALSALALGDHQLVASYVGNGSFDGSTSAPTTMSIISADNVSVGDLSVVEGAAGTSLNVSVPVVLSHPPAGTITVGYSITNGTATSGTDYSTNHMTGVLTFKSTQTVKYVVVKVLGNNAQDGDRTFHVSAVSPGGGFVVRRNGTVTIVDDDPQPSGVLVGVGDVSIPEGDAGHPHGAKLTVRLSHPVNALVVVKLTLSSLDATHKAGTNAADWSGAIVRTVKFPANATAKPLSVGTFPDTRDEMDESVQVTVTSVTGVDQTVAMSGRSVGTVRILSDE